MGPKCSFLLDKIVVPSIALLYPACKNNNQVCGGLGRVYATGMYRSIEHVKFSKFQTRIFVEWKAPVLSQWSVKSGGDVVDAEEIMTTVTGNEKGKQSHFCQNQLLTSISFNSEKLFKFIV